MRSAGRLHARWVDVQVQVVVHTAVRPAASPCAAQSGSTATPVAATRGGGSVAPNESVMFRRAHHRRRDRTRELGRIAHEQIGCVGPSGRYQVGKHRLGAHGTEQPGEHEVRPFWRWHLADLWVALVEHRHGDAIVEPGHRGRDPLPLQSAADLVAGCPEHVVAAVKEGSCQGHHRVDVAPARGGGEEDSHRHSLDGRPPPGGAADMREPRTELVRSLPIRVLGILGSWRW